MVLSTHECESSKRLNAGVIFSIEENNKVVVYFGSFLRSAWRGCYRLPLLQVGARTATS